MWLERGLQVGTGGDDLGEECTLYDMALAGHAKRTLDFSGALLGLTLCTMLWLFFFKLLITPVIIHPSVYSLSPPRKDTGRVLVTAVSPATQAAPSSLDAQ